MSVGEAKLVLRGKCPLHYAIVGSKKRKKELWEKRGKIFGRQSNVVVLDNPYVK